MAEEAGDAGPSVDTGGLAADLAMEEARGDPSLRGHVAGFLDDQRRLIADQRHHLHRQLPPALWEKWLGVFLRAATAAVGLGVAAGASLMVWQASHSNSLVIDAFAMPPDMVERGLTGEVVARQMLDRMRALNISGGFRSSISYANVWNNEVKVEIPETGVSIGELQRFLTAWLGHDTRISGEVYHNGGGIAVAARASGGDTDTSLVAAPNATTFTGKEEELDALLGKAAEDLFQRTQPYRYAGYLRSRGRVDEAAAIYDQLTRSGLPRERAWAWTGKATISGNVNRDMRAALADMAQAFARWPDFAFGYGFAADMLRSMSLPEAELASRRSADRLLAGSASDDIQPEAIPGLRLANRVLLAALLGDFAGEVSLARQSLAMPVLDGNHPAGFYRQMAASALIQQHDAPGARTALRDMPATPYNNSGPMIADTRIALWIAADAGDWRGLVEEEARGEKAARDFNAKITNRYRYDSDIEQTFNHSLRPWLALARAHLDDFAGAQALIGPTEPDCDECLRLRGAIAELQGQRGRADYWFARAARLAPSIPFADQDWGRALLGRGQADAAMEKFSASNRKGPHFADPLEGWGEALMASSQSHLALAKFAEAEKYAPNWGRLHLKWGEALVYAGKKDEAKAQFARAAQLDLTPSDKSELARRP